MKKLFSVLLVVFILLGTFIPVSANSLLDIEFSEIIIKDRFELEKQKQSRLFSFRAAYDFGTANNRIYEAVMNVASECYLYDLGIPVSELMTLVEYIYDTPELFNYDLSFQISYSYIGSTIYSIFPEYYFDKTTFNAIRTDYENIANKLLTGVINSDRLSDVEKALLLHDRLAVHCEYDYGNFCDDTIPWYSHSMYGALYYGTALCDGYAEAYKYLLEQVGIDSDICVSNALEHAWNIVEIGSERYHVDVTWDDPTQDITGRVDHNNFLRSSNGIYSTGHTAYDYDASPYDTKYDSAFWQNSSTEFVLLDGRIYYFDNSAEQLCLMSNSGNKILKNISDIWLASAFSSWAGNFTRLSSDNDYLYYSTSKAIKRYDPKTDAEKLVYSPDLSAEKYLSIYGFRCLDGVFKYDIYTSPNIAWDPNKVGIKDYRYSEDNSYIKLSDDIVVAGDRAYLPVIINSDEAITDITLNLNFDSEVFNLADIRKSALSGFTVKSQSATSSGASVRIISSTGRFVNGEIITLIFDVCDDAALGEHQISFSSNSGLETFDSTVLLKESFAGDTNGDELLDLRDFVRLKKNIASGGKHIRTCDLNGDKIIGANDLIEMRNLVFG